MFDKFNSTFNEKNAACYVKCKDKMRIDKKFYHYNDILKEKEIGYWVQEPFIVIDVDNKRDANILNRIVKYKKLNCAIFKSRKGAHFVFRQNKRHKVKQVVRKKSVLGLEFDTRTENKGYIVLPHCQPERKWIKIPNEIDELPGWLFPQTKIKDIPEFGNLGEGDGRNDTLFRYFKALIDYSKNMTINEKKETIELINRFILEEPLEEEELEKTVLREELIEDLGDPDLISNVANNDPDVIANKVIRDYDIITKNQVMYMFSKGYYKPISEDELHYVIHHSYDKHAKDHKRNEIVKFIRVKTDIRDEEVDKEPMIINLKNCRLNLQSMDTMDHDENVYDTIRIPYEYNPGAKPSTTLKNFLKFISEGKKDKLKLLYEMIGMCLLKKPIKEKLFILVGDKGANGKSTLLEIIENLLGSDNTANIDLGDIATDEHAAFELYGKLANIGDDLKLSALKETGLIKSLTSGKYIQAKVKYKNRFKFKNTATMIFAANRIPITYDKSGGFFRRFVIIRFDRSVPVAQRDPFLIEKLTRQDYEYLLKMASKSINNVICTNELTELEESKKALESYKNENSNVLMFLEENNISLKQIDLYPVRELYSSYKEYCQDCGYKPLQKSIFDADISQKFNAVKKSTTKAGRDNLMRWIIEEE